MPAARLVPLNGLLYGTTSAGGSSCRKSCGTVYAISTSGSEKVLHDFAGRPDGADPLSELTAVKSLLYGTTASGGTICLALKRRSGCGTVFTITPSGTERVLYRFGRVPDGAHPSGPLIEVNGELYGVSSSGGAKCAIDRRGCGTVYSVDSAGRERVLYRFVGNPDGAVPTGNLVFINSRLYGTTLFGGSCNRGTIFDITLSGNERVLYSASCSGVDIAYPSGLVALDGVLYGTSQKGGARQVGAIYSVTTRGKEHILRIFAGWNGGDPKGSLSVVNGALYGTTAFGANGFGEIYAVNTSGALHVLYRFKGAPDGSIPYAGLTYLKDTLYGTTSQGGSGCHYQGCQNGLGTVFRLSP